MRSLFLVIIVSLYCTTLCHAGDLHVVLNGKAIHLDKGDYNEKNWGFGLHYEFSPRQQWNTFVNASWFKDSNNNTSRYIGSGIKREYRLDDSEDGWFAEVGVIAFVMTRKDLHDNKPFLGILPAFALGNGPVTLNMTYIPAVSPKHKDLLFFQLMLRVMRFD